jgi:hypothetical protein
MTIKTTLAPNASWPSEPPKQKRIRIRKPRPKTYAKTQPVKELDYLREAREQLAEMINNRRTA